MSWNGFLTLNNRGNQMRRRKRIEEWISQLERTATLKRRLNVRPCRKEKLETRICEQAYKLFEQRGYSHGSDMDDWLEAEEIVTKKLPR